MVSEGDSSGRSDMASVEDARRSFVLDVEWFGVDLPRLIGPFDTEQEALQWEALNAPNGSGVVRELAYPYAKAAR